MKLETIKTKIWQEHAQTKHPFMADSCYCSGYNVYQDILPNASWIEYLFLLFQLELPTAKQARLLEKLAIALANAGPRDYSVRAAMNGGVGGSSSAACLMAALGVGAGSVAGAREVLLAMQAWQHCGLSLALWQQYLSQPKSATQADVWPEAEHPMGFDPYANTCAQPVQQTLAVLVDCQVGEYLLCLQQQQGQLEQWAQCPLAMSGVAAAALSDLGFNPEQGEMLYLLLRLPGAAVHALEQRQLGWAQYPFFAGKIDVVNDPKRNQDEIND